MVSAYRDWLEFAVPPPLVQGRHDDVCLLLPRFPRPLLTRSKIFHPELQCMLIAVVYC